MKAQEYIEQRLKGIKEKKVKQEGTLADFIYEIIMSKKFRKYSMNPEAYPKIHEAIELNIKNNEPIKIVIPFGSYKLYKFEESPEPDWAELFAMIYYAYWLKPITDVYKPGVWFDFCADDAILELMNKIPEEDTNKYKKIFRELIEFIKLYLPDNFKYTFSPVGERYSSKEEFLADLNYQINILEKNGATSMTEKEIRRMKINIKTDNKEDINLEENHIIHDAYMNIDKRRSYHKTPDRISISATPFGKRTSIPVGTTKTSAVQFQVGIGVLGKHKDSLIEYIYSFSQLEKSKFDLEDINFNGLSGKNFNRIRILQG
jgi:pyoverdine/dityrosine biosynthesis protein Dit1